MVGIRVNPAGMVTFSFAIFAGVGGRNPQSTWIDTALLMVSVRTGSQVAGLTHQVSTFPLLESLERVVSSSTVWPSITVSRTTVSSPLTIDSRRACRHHHGWPGAGLSLLNVQPGDGPPDNYPLDLRRAR